MNILSLITLMLFQTRTQIKIFLMKSESFLTLHKHQVSYHVQGPERYQKHRRNSPCNISGSTVILGSFGNTFCCAKKTTLFNNSSPPCHLSAILKCITIHACSTSAAPQRLCCLCADQSSLMICGICFVQLRLNH